MANYWQFRSKHPEYKSAYWVCGEEMALRLEVVDSVVSQFQCQNKYWAEASDFSRVEDIILCETQERKVVVVEHAEAFKDYQADQVTKWASKIVAGKMGQTILIVHADEKNPDTAQPRYRPFVEKGRFVECKAMSVDGMRKYAMEDYKLTQPAADLLAELVSFNFLKFNNELEKIHCLNLESVDENIVRELVVFSAEDIFVKYMLSRNLNGAKMVVSAVNSSTVGSVLTHLAKKLSFLYLLFINDKPGTDAHRLAAVLGVQPWQLLEFFAIKRVWNSHLIMEKLKILTAIESQYSTHNTNPLPLLAAWW